MKTKEQLRKEIGILRDELSDIERSEWIEENAPLVGTYWKYRNSYSSTDKPTDYWWCYRKILSFRDQSFVTAEFQTDKFGNHRIDRNDYVHHSQGWVKCTAKEYRTAWKRLQKKLNYFPT